jgi:prepilin-type N-terminal cleavage/methylation domain-containing protein
MKIKSLLSRFSPRGFTLIELLIVIAILGVLAATVLVAIDPVEQLNRGRDAGRKSSISQLGRALQAYYTATSAYPVVGGWNTTIVGSGDIKVFPANPGSPTVPGCSGGNVANNYCYKVNATPDVVVYSHMESKLEKNKGTCGGVDLNTWYVYSSAEGKAGTLCQAAEPAAGATGLLP